MAEILVIDDEADIRESLKILLEDKGYAVTVAPNGSEGLKQLRSRDFDLVITDLIMPVQEGLETIRWIRKEKPQVRIIAMSGGGKVSPGSYLEVARTLGADFVFDKPMELEDLYAAVQELIG